MTLRRINAVHTILADRALILFITTASLSLPLSHVPKHLPSAPPPSSSAATAPASNPPVTLAIWQGDAASSQLGAWLARQDADPRTTLVLEVEYAAQSRAAAWEEAAQLERIAQASGRTVRVSLREGSTDRTRAVLSYEPASAQP